MGIDSNDNLFVCDTQHDRIVKMSGKNICETFMDNVHKPTDITIFKDHFFVVETWNHSVKQYDINGNLLQTIAVEGRMPGQLKNPGNCQVNDNGDLFIADVNNYRIQVFSTDTVPDQKAIIVAGGGDYPGNDLWDATQICAYFAYRTMRFCKLKKKDIKLLTSGKIFDLDNNQSDDNFLEASPENLKNVIKNWGASASQLIVYLVDHGAQNEFIMDYNTKLHAHVFKQWLPQDIQVIVIYDACHSQSFMTQMKESPAYVITSAEKEAYFVNKGLLSFSYLFWNRVLTGNDINSSFDYAQNMMSSITMRLQQPKMSYYTPIPVYIGQRLQNQDSCSLTYFDYDEKTNALIAKTNAAVEQVWVELAPPTLTVSERPSTAPVLGFPSVKLVSDDDTIYKGVYQNEFSMAHDIFFCAKDFSGNICISEPVSIPSKKIVNRKALLIATANARDITHNLLLSFDALVSRGYNKSDISIFGSNHPKSFKP